MVFALWLSIEATHDLHVPHLVAASKEILWESERNQTLSQRTPALIAELRIGGVHPIAARTLFGLAQGRTAMFAEFCGGFVGLAALRTANRSRRPAGQARDHTFGDGGRDRFCALFGAFREIIRRVLH